MMRPNLKSAAIFAWVVAFVVLGSLLVVASFIPSTKTIA